VSQGDTGISLQAQEDKVGDGEQPADSPCLCSDLILLCTLVIYREGVGIE
jgi:hypothetical protein